METSEWAHDLEESVGGGDRSAPWRVIACRPGRIAKKPKVAAPVAAWVVREHGKHTDGTPTYAGVRREQRGGEWIETERVTTDRHGRPLLSVRAAEKRVAEIVAERERKPDQDEE